MWCDACRSTGAIHCAMPDECGNMLSATAAADNWKAWLDDLPLPFTFDPAIGRLQDFITGLTARIEAQAGARADAQAAVALVARLVGLIRWAHETLWELNPNNYDHDEVCKANDAAVEVILGLAPVIGETHGYSPEWWAARAALATQEAGT